MATSRDVTLGTRVRALEDLPTLDGVAVRKGTEGTIMSIPRTNGGFYVDFDEVGKYLVYSRDVTSVARSFEQIAQEFESNAVYKGRVPITVIRVEKGMKGTITVECSDASMKFVVVHEDTGEEVLFEWPHTQP